MSTSNKSLSKKRRPLRKLVFLAVLVGIAVAIKNAIEDKGGSYEAPSTPAQVPTPTTPSTAPGPVTVPDESPVVTAEQIVVSRPVENLEEFADPVDASDDEPADDAAPTQPRQARKRSAVAEALAEAEEGEDVNEVLPGKIDPFGIR